MHLVRTAARARARVLGLAVAVAVGVGSATVAQPAAAGGGCHSPTSEGTGTTVELSNLCMSPTVLRTDAGATVTFVNRDPMEHNVSSNGFYANLPKAGDTWQYRFPEAGTYAYACLLHPGMTGAVVVGNGVGVGPVVDVGPYRPERATAAASSPSPLVSSRDGSRRGSPASVPLPLAVVLGAAIAAGSAGATRRLSATRRQPHRPGESAT